MSTKEEGVPTLGEQAHGSDFVQSLERGLSILRVFDAANPSLTLSEAAKRTGLSRATARRILHTFEALGYVRTDGRRFALTPKVLDLGYAYLSSLQVGDIALPYMEALSEQIHESVSAAVLDGVDIVYVARVPTRKIMRLSLALGSRLPAVDTSMGRVLLADLPDDLRADILDRAPLEARTDRSITDRDVLEAAIDAVRTQGWAIVDQELEEGLRSVAAPLRDRTGRAVAALNVGTSAGTMSLKELRSEVLPRLLQCAGEISAQLAKR